MEIMHFQYYLMDFVLPLLILFASRMSPVDVRAVQAPLSSMDPSLHQEGFYNINSKNDLRGIFQLDHVVDLNLQSINCDTLPLRSL